ncbi:MAG: hypothetical protein A2057_15515 [Ignavibacteria bacterium GWA2_35_9]|nr:MAG: hypothetical protein A2057_15515 [Ignavibacteria bacterium GWA2_35_9]OGU48389.1 MAG: hypothetical protein A2000_15425 [Ignavibacteria bacterium GWB2_36_8]OGU53828.1 MAG: hypothetical protein A2080_02820 [Ignavibacteria bacterium GWC2_36_12]
MFNCKYKISFSYFFFCLFFLSNFPFKAQDKTGTKKILRTIADAILNDATFQFVDKKTSMKIITSVILLTQFVID